jgi:hypothetical protein
MAVVTVAVAASYSDLGVVDVVVAVALTAVVATAPAGVCLSMASLSSLV